MILSKDSNNNWAPTAGGTGTFIGTLAAFNAIKDTLPVNTVAYITDDGNGDLQPVDAVTDGNMHPVTSNAVYDNLKNYVQQKVFDIPRGSYVNGMDLTSYVNSQLSAGYEFLSWVMIMSNGWIIDHPIYMASPGKEGFPYTNSQDVGDLKVYFLERRIL